MEYAGLITVLVFCAHVGVVVLRDVLFGRPVEGMVLLDGD